MITLLLLLCIVVTTISLLAVVYGTVHNKKEVTFAGGVSALATIWFLIILVWSGWLS